jgi:hypothetical protein
MARGNGSSGLDYADASEAEAEAAGDREGLRWLAARLRSVRIAILQLTMRNQLSAELEIELRQLEQEFRQRVEEDDE